MAGVTGPKIQVLFDMTELQGWELRAAWDDFKIGLKHGGDFEKVAQLPQIMPQKQLATSGLAAPARPTSRVAGITVKAKANTLRRRQEMIARFAVGLESNRYSRIT